MRIVIVGGGIAAAYLADKIKSADAAIDVVILSKEPYSPYDRIHLCRLIDQSVSIKDIELPLPKGVRLELNQEIIGIDPKNKKVFSKTAFFSYDYLIIATGSKPKAPFDTSNLINAATIRSADDSLKIAKNIKGRSIVIVGTGPLGIEALETFCNMKETAKITVLSRSNSLYSRALDANGVKLIENIYLKTGKVFFSFDDELLDVTIQENQIISATTKRLTIQNPFILFAIGIMPNIDFARESLACKKGILVNERMQTSDPFIYAVGEAAEVEGFVAGHVKECTQQAEVAVANILGTKPLSFKRSYQVDSLKVGAFDLVDVTAPSYQEDKEYENVVFFSPSASRLDQFILQDERLVRFIGINSNMDLDYIRTLIEEHQPIDATRLFGGRTISKKGRLLCSCTSTYEEDLKTLIAKHSITSFDELQGYSKAGRICGRCRKQLVDYIAAHQYLVAEGAQKPKKTVEELRREQKIKEAYKRIEKYNRLHPQNPIDTADLDAALRAFEIKKEEFNSWIGMMTQKLGLHLDFEGVVQKAIVALNKIPIIWLELADCSGNSEAFLKSARPSIEDLIFDYISLDYHELLMSASADASEMVLEEIIKTQKGNYLLIVEGAVPLGLDGKYLRIGREGQTGVELLRRTALHAAKIIAIGSCALDGGVVAAHPNPTGAVGVSEALGRKDIINISGCPANPINLIGTLLYYIMFDEWPPLDQLGRPLWAYGQTNHDKCERRSHYDNDEFVEHFGDNNAKKGWCLYKVGCKGPYAYANCATAKFNESTSWPVQAGHGCIACVEPKFFDRYAFLKEMRHEEDRD